MNIITLAVVMGVGFVLILVGCVLRKKYEYDMELTPDVILMVVGLAIMVVSVVPTFGFMFGKVEATTNSSEMEIACELAQTRTEKGDFYLVQKGDKVQFYCYLDGALEPHEVGIDEVSVTYAEDETPKVEYTKTIAEVHEQWLFLVDSGRIKETEGNYRFVIPNRESLSLGIEK